LTADEEQLPKEPWSKFYWSDWRGDPKLRMCGFGARGLWMDMLSIMHEAEPRGHLLIAGVAPTPRQIASVTGGTVNEITKLQNELEAANVFSRTAHGVIFSRRMVKETARRKVNRKNGKGGGNPALLDNQNSEGRITEPDNPHPQETDKTQKLEARSQRLDTFTSGILGGSEPDPGATPAMQVAQAFDRERVLAFGPERARPWRHSDDISHAERFLAAGADLDLCRRVFKAILEKRKAENDAPIDNLGYFPKAIARAISQRGKPMPVTGERAPESDLVSQETRLWTGRILAVKGGATWNESQWGPHPSDPRNWIPADVREFLKADLAALSKPEAA
jgi:hypothetical protein